MVFYLGEKMAEIVRKISLSTTEPNNYVGIIKVRQGDENTQVLDIQITENGLIKPFTGLKPFFCLMAREITGQGVSEESVNNFNASNGTLKHTLSANAYQMVGNNDAYFSFRRENSKGEWIEQFSTRSFSYIVEKGIYSAEFKDSNYWWTFKELYRLLSEYINSSKDNWTNFVNKNKEILESVDPGGKILSELLAARHETINEVDKPDINERIKVSETILKNRILQTSQSGDFFRRLRSTQDSLSIACIGDSLTYGYDINSADKRPADTVPTDNGTSHVRERASQTYPEALQEFLNVVYPNRTAVRNMGYSGDNVNSCMQHWHASGADLAIIMLGTNDANTFGIDVFTKGYRALIARELESGASVLIITPPKKKNANDEKISSYRNAVIELAKELNIPCIDMASEMANLDQAYYSDTTHFNGKGYRFIGAKVLAVLSGESILNSKKVNSTYLSLRNQIDGFKNIDGGGFLSNENQYPTPAELTEKVGIAGLLKPEKSFFYSFYTENDNTVIYPSVYFPNSDTASLTLMLDFSVEGQAISNSNLVHSQKTNLMTKSTVIYDVNDLNFTSIKSFDRRAITSLVDIDYYTGKCLIIPKKGFHTIKVTNTGLDQFNFFGLYVTTLEEFYAIKMSNTPNRYDFLTNKAYNDGIELPEKKINVRDLMNVLRTKINYSTFGDNPTLKISIRSWEKVHVVYYIHLARIPGITSTIMDPPQIFKFKNYSGTDYRTLIGVEWEYEPSLSNPDLANLVLKFGGNTAIQSFISIEVG